MPSPRMLVPLMLLLACGTPQSSRPGTPTAPVAAAITAFTDAWLTNDSARVMATLTADVVFVPHHGYPIQAGDSALREWWWPRAGGPGTIITRFTMHPSEILVRNDVAWARGITDLAWVSTDAPGDTLTNWGSYLVGLHREPEGWQIFHLASSDTLPRKAP